MSTPTRLTAARYPWKIDFCCWEQFDYLQEGNARLGNCNGEGDNGQDVEQVEGASGEVGQVQASSSGKVDCYNAF